MKKFCLIFLITALLLCGCALEPEEEISVPEIADDGTVRVSTVDELLNAIAPDAKIQLAEGEYMLSDAESYGKSNVSDYYRWAEGFDGYELQLENVENLQIIGSGSDNCRIVTEPRSANVLSISSGNNINLRGLTLGHTDSGLCTGGVLKLNDAEEINLVECELFGCGTVALVADSCKNISLENSVLRDCSIRAAEINSCYDVRVEDCEIYGCGIQGQPNALFMISSSEGFALVNSKVYENEASVLLAADFSGQLSFLGNEVSKNRLYEGMFALRQYSAVVDGCGFEDNSFENWYAPEADTNWIGQGSAVKAINIRGKVLDEEALSAMVHQTAVYSGPVPRPVEENSQEQPVVHVETADEFLAAIAPNTQIFIDAELIDLSLASDYGSYGGEYYSWRSCFDGPELVIKDVDNLQIIGLGRDKTTISATPRYANVLNFENCSQIEVRDLTAGHTKEPGSCAGGVLNYFNSKDLVVENCGLFGCGILGISAERCQNMEILNTEIYECSLGAARFYACKDVEFIDCVVRDVPQPAFYADVPCDSISFNGEYLFSGGLGDGLSSTDSSGTKLIESPKPDSGIPVPDEGLGIFFGNNWIVSDCTIRVGDEPVTLKALSFPGGNFAPVSWKSSHPEQLTISPLDEGRCQVEVTGGVYGGAVLTAYTDREEVSITIYCVG